MKFLVILAVAVASAAAAEIPTNYFDVPNTKYVRSDEATAPIVRSDYESHPDGHFSSVVETGNGIYTQSEGVVKNPNTDTAALEIKGSVRYTSPDGTPVNYEYVANEGGYQVVGSHVPVPPPVPELILRSLQYIADHPAPVERVVKKP
ncbi:larval cuticle protein LCP-17-like [Melitaea cinxia]|uniref:larval cuticle protein LCP-17-like n=1 Tax=Melitaea cinxia TaxID=113334 RepID=UPI001E26FFCD|nr:larval cuticle protein LCP-17-like [Melitaea cinxia]